MLNEVYVVAPPPGLGGGNRGGGAEPACRHTTCLDRHRAGYFVAAGGQDVLSSSVFSPQTSCLRYQLIRERRLAQTRLCSAPRPPPWRQRPLLMPDARRRHRANAPETHLSRPVFVLAATRRDTRATPARPWCTAAAPSTTYTLTESSGACR